MRVLESRLPMRGARRLSTARPPTAEFPSPPNRLRQARQRSALDARSICRPEPEAFHEPSSQPRFQRGGEVRFLVAVFDDDRRLQTEVLIRAPARPNSTRTGHDDRTFRNLR